MVISGIKSAESASGEYTGKTQQTVDTVSKNLQNEIASVQRQKQELSSKEGMTAEEKSKKRQELQQELGSLNVQLRRRQAEARKEQRKEILEGEMRLDKAKAPESNAAGQGGAKVNSAKPEGDSAGKTGENNAKADVAGPDDTKANAAWASDFEAGGVKGASAKAGGTRVKDTQNQGTESTGPAVRDAENKNEKVQAADEKDTDKAGSELQSVIASRPAIDETKVKGTIIARIEGGIAILKSEIKQDEARGVDTEQKEEELAKQEEKVQRAYQFPAAGGTEMEKENGPQFKVVGAEEEESANMAIGGGDKIIINAGVR